MLKKTFCLTAVLVVFWVKSAWALDMDFYTYGGFDLMVQAFNMVALIFSDIDFQGLLTVFAIFGVIGGALVWLFAAMSGVRVIPLDWAVKILIGAVIYLAIFVPTGHIAIFDATLNETQTIGGIPNAVVLVAGSLNMVERVVSTICDTFVGPAKSYSANGGGMGFGMLQTISNAQDVYATMSMEQYMNKCVIFETQRSGATIGFGDLLGNNTDFMATLANAQNPAVFTIYYDSTTTNGTPMTCTDAWTRLQPIFSVPTAYDNALAKTCNSANLDATNPSVAQACKNLITNAVNAGTGTSYTYDTILRQSQLSAMLYQTFSGNTQASAGMQADRTIVSSGFGSDVTLNGWIPIIKTILTAIALTMVPFLTLLLPTPVVGKAIGAMFGFFVFLTIWGITDAVATSIAMSYASNNFQAIGPNNLGMLAMSAMPTLAAKTVAMFGWMRAAGLTLVAGFTAMFVKFGGSALAHFAGSLMAPVSQGSQAGGKMFTPEGRTEEQKRLLDAWSNMSVEGQEKFVNRGRAMALEEERRIQNANNAITAAGQAEANGDVVLGTSQSLQGVARMMSGQQNLTTDKGKFNATIGPDGHTNMLDEMSVNSAGTNVTSKIGAGGQGAMTHVTTGANALDYRFDGQGGADLASWQSKAIDPLKLGQTNRDILTTSAAHSFVRNNGIERFLSEAKNASGSDAASRAQNDTFNKNLGSNFERNMGEGSDFNKKVSKEDQQTLRTFAEASAGGNLGIASARIGARGELIAQGTDGKTHTAKVSEATAGALKEAQSKAFAEAMNHTASTQEGMAWASSIAQKSGNSEAFSQLNEARNMSIAQQSYGENLNVPFLKHFASTHFDGSTTPAALDRSADFLSTRITAGGDKGKAYVDSAYRDFLRSYSSPTSEAVQGNIGAWGGNAHGGVSGASAAMDRTKDATDTISPENFRGGRNVGGWSETAKGIQTKIEEDKNSINYNAGKRKTDNEQYINENQTVPGVVREMSDLHPKENTGSKGILNEVGRISGKE